MDYTKKVAMVLMFLMVVITPGETVAHTLPKDDPFCSSLMEDLIGNCLRSAGTPTEACCNDLKSATTKQVRCICEMFVPNKGFSNITGSPADGLPTLCGIADKFSCGISEGSYTIDRSPEISFLIVRTYDIIIYD